MKNPVTEFRERLNLKRKEFSVLYGVKASTLANSESGNSSIVAEKILEAFRRAGISWEELVDIQERYQKWLRQTAEADFQRRKDLGMNLHEIGRA